MRCIAQRVFGVLVMVGLAGVWPGAGVAAEQAAGAAAAERRTRPALAPSPSPPTHATPRPPRTPAVRSAEPAPARPPEGRAPSPTGRRPFHAAEGALAAIFVGGSGGTAGLFFGGTAVLQGGHHGALVGVAELGVGAALDDDPDDPARRRARAQLWFALGARLRLLHLLGGPRARAWDLSVGPLGGILANHEVVTLALGGELTVAYHFGRLRLSLSAQGGWARILAQEVPDRLTASYFVGALLGAGARF